jgi:hypothetical protein
VNNLNNLYAIYCSVYVRAFNLRDIVRGGVRTPCRLQLVRDFNFILSVGLCTPL